MRDLVISCSNIDWHPLLHDWRWLVPSDDTALFLGAFGDWVCGAPDGSIWSLELLEGTYSRIAGSAEEYNLAKASPDNLNLWFMAEWVEIAERHGLVPGMEECLGWKLHPIFGGSFSVENIQVFSLVVYQSLMGQLFRQIRR
ncbi:MAG: T6SS immunity protein Tdi1 domain-containing protein [Sphingomonas sp.]